MNAEGEKKDVRRPMNGFLIFCNTYRGSIQKSNPAMDNRNVTKALGDLWANLGDEKKVYMNIAQQQKDAFMMANPGYKWHKEKIQNVPRKSVIKPAQAHGSKTRVNKRELSAMNPCDRTVEIEQCSSRLGQHSIDEVRDSFHNQSFTEPRVNGLVLTGEREKCRNQRLSDSFMPLETSTPMSVRPVLAAANIHQQPMSFFTALLDVAAILYQELQQQFSSVQPSPQIYLSTQADPTLLQPSPGHVRGCRRPKPPPKKRAWNLTESADALADASVISCHGDDVSKQTLFTQESYSDSYSTDVEACKMILPRRKFSATTESPSPLCSFTTGTEESPRFSETWNQSENSTQKSDSCDIYVKTFPIFDIISDSRTPQSTLTFESPKYQPLPDTCPLEMPRKLFVHDSDRISAEHDLPYNNFFQQHPEPGMPDKKFGYKCTENLAPGAASTHIADNYYPDSKFDLTREKQPRHPTQKLSLNELKPKNGIFPALSSDEKVFSAPPSPYTKSTLASLLSKGKLVSLLSTNVAVDRQAVSVPEVHHSAHKTLQKIENIDPTCDKQSHNRLTDSRKQAEQFLLTNKSNFVNENNFSHGRLGHLTEPESADLHLPLSQAQNFSERKLKKKWEERMLVETKQEGVGRCQVAVRHDSKDDTVRLLQASANNVTLQGMSLLCISDPEHSLETDRLQMHQKQGRSVFPVEQKPILIQPHSSLDAKSSQAPSISSSNSSRYSKLRQQLSQNQPLLKPDLPRLQSPFKIQPEASNRSYPSHSSLSSGHQQFMDNPNNTKAGRDTEVPHDRKVLDHVATYGKRFMDHILKQFYKTDLSEDKKIVRDDICEDRQTMKIANPGFKEFPCDGNSSAPVVKSESEQKPEPVLAGLREVNVDRYQNDLVDYKMLTASSLVEKVVREFCDSSQRKDVYDSANKTEIVTPSDDHDIDDTDASHMTTEPDSLSKQTLIEISSEHLENSGRNKQVSACANGEDSVQCQLTPVAVGSSNYTDIADATIIQPIRKSRRANRGQKYQELIKEGIIQPSRERLASRSGEKSCKNHGTKEVCSQVETRKVQPPAVLSDGPGDGCAAASSLPADSNAEELSISRNVEVCMADPALPVRSPGLKKRKGHTESDDDNTLPHPHCDNNHSSVCLKGSNIPRKMSRRHRNARSQSEDENTLSHPHCDDNPSSARLKGGNNYKKMTQCHRSAPSQIQSDNSSNQISAIVTTLPMLKAAIIGSECPIGCSSLPQRNQVGDQISGSQKRKARRHSIMRISADHEEIEDLETSSSIERCALQLKKPRLSSESQIVSLSASQEVSSSSLNNTLSQSQLLDSCTDSEVKGKVVSVEMITGLGSKQNITEITDITDKSVTVLSRTDAGAQSSSDVVVGANSCTSFSPITTSTPIISYMSFTSCRPIVSSMLVTSSTPNLSITSSTSNISISGSITSTAPFASSTPNISISRSTPIISSVSTLKSMSLQSLMPIASSTPMVMSKKEATSFEFNILSDLSKKEQENISSGRELSNKKLEICANETTNKKRRQVIMSEAEIGQECTQNSGTLEVTFDEESKSPLYTTSCDSPLHVKSILECTHTHTGSSPALIAAPRMTSLNLSAQSHPFDEAENISLYTGLHQDDSKHSTVMDVSSMTALLTSHSACSLPVIEICECMQSPALESSSLVNEVTFATKPALRESIPVPVDSVSRCHDSSTSSCFTYSHMTPSSSALCSVANILSSAYSSTSNTVISMASPIVNLAVNGSSPVLDTVSTNMIGSPHLPESPSVAAVQS